MDLHVAKHFLQVWGCGSTATKDKQNEQKQWEKKETEKHKQRKV